MVDRGAIKQVVTWALLISLVASACGVVYFAANPPTVTEPFTEFYILGPSGNAAGYPTDLTVGETGTVIVGVTNHEHRAMSYTVVMKLDNETVRERFVKLGNEETWESEMSFTVQEAGRKRLRLELYRGEVSREPYRVLRLWVNVTE